MVVVFWNLTFNFFSGVLEPHPPLPTQAPSTYTSNQTSKENMSDILHVVDDDKVSPRSLEDQLYSSSISLHRHPTPPPSSTSHKDGSLPPLIKQTTSTSHQTPQVTKN